MIWMTTLNGSPSRLQKEKQKLNRCPQSVVLFQIRCDTHSNKVYFLGCSICRVKTLYIHSKTGQSSSGHEVLAYLVIFLCLAGRFSLRLRNERRNSIPIARHYTDLGRAGSYG